MVDVMDDRGLQGVACADVTIVGDLESGTPACIRRGRDLCCLFRIFPMYSPDRHLVVDVSLCEETGAPLPLDVDTFLDRYHVVLEVMIHPYDGACAGNDKARIWHAIKERHDVCVAGIGRVSLAASMLRRQN